MEAPTLSEPVQPPCPHCHAAVPINSQFCPNCGQRVPPPVQQVQFVDAQPMHYFKFWANIVLPLQLILAIPTALINFIFLLFDRSTLGLIDCCVKAVFFVAIFALVRLLLPEFRDRAQDGLRHLLMYAGVSYGYYLYTQIFELLTAAPTGGMELILLSIPVQVIFWVLNYLYFKKRLVNP